MTVVSRLESRTRRLPVGVDPGTFTYRSPRPPSPRARILTVAGLVPIKGIDVALRAVARVARSHPSVSYDIIGDGPLRDPLTNLTRELGIEANVRLRGAATASEVQAAMAEADLFILASVNIDGDQEGQGSSCKRRRRRGCL